MTDIIDSRAPDRLSGVGARPIWAVNRRTTERAESELLLGTARDGSLTLRPLRGDTRVRHSRRDHRMFAVEEIELSGPARIVAGPRSGVVIVEALEPTARQPHGLSADGSTAALQVGQPLLAGPGMPWTVEVDGGRVRLVSVESALLRRVARCNAGADDLRFTSPRLSSDSCSETWHRGVRFVRESLWAPHQPAAPQMIDACARVLAATVLQCFPYDPIASLSLPADGPAIPVQLRAALSFVEDNARNDIGIDDIADAVHLSPRAVQYLFRRHVDLTPSEYLRRVRLHHAHRDLVASDKSSTTVGQVAARWRFAHTGRFAVMYRQLYGESPHETLRD